MRRRAILTAITAAAVAVALLPSPARAKMGIGIDTTPAGLQVGEVWTPVIQYLTDAGPTALPGAHHVAVRITNLRTGATRTSLARPTSPSAWEARVRFPTAGKWRYTIQGFGGRVGRQSWDPVTIAPRPRSTAAGGTRSSGRLAGEAFPVGWSILGAAVLLATALLVVRVRRSPG